MRKAPRSKRSRIAGAAGAPLWLLLAVLLFGPAADARGLPKLLILDTVFLDFMMSGEGETFTTPEEEAQVKAAADVLRKKMAAAGGFDVLTFVKKDSYNDAIDLSCADCILGMARARGADYVMTSAVTRFNNVLLSLKVELDNVATEKAVKISTVGLQNIDAAQIDRAANFVADKFTDVKPDSPAGTQNYAGKTKPETRRHRLICVTPAAGRASRES